jgi:hypothetical protein
MDNAVDYHPGLAGTGPGQDEERSLAVEDRLPLGRIEMVEGIIQP